RPVFSSSSTERYGMFSFWRCDSICSSVSAWTGVPSGREMCRAGSSPKKFGNARITPATHITSTRTLTHVGYRFIGFSYPFNDLLTRAQRLAEALVDESRSGALDRPFRQDGRDGVLLHLHRDVVGELDRNVLIADLLDLAEQPAPGHDLVPAAERLDHLPMLLLPFRLRTDQQEVEDHDDQDQRQEAHQRIGLSGLALRPRVLDKKAGQKFHARP